MTGELNVVDSLTESVSREWQHAFLKRACRGPQRLPPTQKRPVFVLACPTRPRLQAVPERCHTRLAIDFQSKPSIDFWNSLREQLPDDRQGHELGLKLELCSLTNGLLRFFMLQKDKSPE